MDILTRDAEQVSKGQEAMLARLSWQGVARGGPSAGSKGAVFSGRAFPLSPCGPVVF